MERFCTSSEPIHPRFDLEVLRWRSNRLQDMIFPSLEACNKIIDDRVFRELHIICKLLKKTENKKYFTLSSPQSRAAISEMRAQKTALSLHLWNLKIHQNQKSLPPFAICAQNRSGGKFFFFN